MNSFERIFGLLFSGFAVKLAGAALALYLAFTFGGVFVEAMGHVKEGFALAH